MGAGTSIVAASTSGCPSPPPCHCHCPETVYTEGPWPPGAQPPIPPPMSRLLLQRRETIHRMHMRSENVRNRQEQRQWHQHQHQQQQQQPINTSPLRTSAFKDLHKQ